MNKSFNFLLVFLITIPLITSGQVDSVKQLPAAHWARARKVDVKHIAIDLRFDWQKRQAFGTTAVTLSLLDAGTEVSLDAGMLTINSIKVNNTLLKFSYDGGDQDNGLKIKLDRTYQVGEDFTVLIDYHTNHINETDPLNLGGSNGKGGLRFIWPTPAEPARKKQIWSLGDPESNRYWFPGYDFLNDFRTTDIKLTVEMGLTAIASGQLVQIKTNPDGTQTFHFRSDIAHANYNTSFIVGEYTNVKQSYSGIELNNYSYTNEVEGTTASVERLPDMMKFFSEYTGIAYPAQSYSQVFVQDLPWGVTGMGVAAQSENMVDDYDTHADYLYLWDALEGESLAWQWTGCYVTPANWSEQWLGKGLSRYLSGLYNIYKNGADEFLLWQHASNDLWIYTSDWNSGIREPIVSKNYASVGGNAPYYYGATVMRMLHKQLGDEKWKKALSLYFKNNAGKPVTTEDFRKAVEEASGDPMEWFFDQWVYRVGYPVFEVSKTYDPSTKELVLTVKQRQQLDSAQLYPQTEFFQGKIEIEIDSKIEAVWLAPRAENVFKFSLSQNPKLVNFDYQSTWLKELTFQKSFDELVYQALHSTDVLARRSALAELTTLAQGKTASQEDKARVISVLQNIIKSNAYWRFRSGVIVRLQSLLVKPDAITTKLLLEIIAKDKSWVKSAAITFLGATEDPKFADVYIKALSDKSDRVVATAAVALGKTKSPKAYDALAKLVSRPSWKNQSLMSSLSGLQQLEDPRAYNIAYEALADLNEPRWNLPQPSTGIWDYRVIAAQTISGLGRSNDAYPLILNRLKKSLLENDLNVIFNNVLLIEVLAEPKGREIFELLKERFKDDENMLSIVAQWETQFKEAIAEK